MNLPIPIRRRAFEARKTDYYGEGKSLEIWVEGWVEGFDARQRVPPERIVPADLTDWRYRPGPGKVAVDPVQGRIAFRQRPKKGLWVSYHYGFSADIGGGEYDRPLSQPTQLLFGKDDFEDPFGLVRKLRQYRDPVSLYLWDQFSEETRQLVGSEDTGRQLEVSGDSDVSPKALRALIDELNKLLQDGDLYDEERFREVTLSEETRRLIEENPRGWGLIRLNRLLLEQAYPDEIVANSVVLYRVGRQQDLKRINAALEKWRDEKPRHAIIEITDSEVYGAQVDDEGQIEVELGRKIELGRNQTLQLRAANNTRPIIRWLDWHPDLPDALTVSGEPGSRFILDGLLIAGRGLQVEGELTSVTIRHSTLVPGWALHEIAHHDDRTNRACCSTRRKPASTSSTASSARSSSIRKSERTQYAS